MVTSWATVVIYRFVFALFVALCALLVLCLRDCLCFGLVIVSCVYNL